MMGRLPKRKHHTHHTMKYLFPVLATGFVLALTPVVLAQTSTDFNCTTSGSLSYCYGSDGSAFSTIYGKNSAYTYGNDSTGQQFQCNSAGGYTSCQ
jgi:hypothetical protein